MFRHTFLTPTRSSRALFAPSYQRRVLVNSAHQNDAAARRTALAWRDIMNDDEKQHVAHFGVSKSSHDRRCATASSSSLSSSSSSQQISAHDKSNHDDHHAGGQVNDSSRPRASTPSSAVDELPSWTTYVARKNRTTYFRPVADDKTLWLRLASPQSNQSSTSDTAVVAAVRQ